ncbi:MAG: hypothetical protein P8104_00940 [Gammaproteobacteria bacterium]
MYDTILEFFQSHPSLWLGLPLPCLIVLLSPTALLFVYFMRQHLNEKHWRYVDRVKALEYAFTQTRPPSRRLYFLNRYLAAVAVLDFVLMVFCYFHGSSFAAMLTPPRGLIWIFALALTVFNHIAKTSLQDKMKDAHVTWVKLTLNTCLAELSDYLVLRFLAIHGDCEEIFEKIFIFPEAPEDSTACEGLGPFCQDPLHLTGVFLTQDTSIFILDKSSHLILHTKDTLRNLLAAEFNGSPEPDEGLLEAVQALPFTQTAAKVVNHCWDCVRLELAQDDDSEDAPLQYSKKPEESERLIQRIPIYKGEFTQAIKSIELFPINVMKMTLVDENLHMSWQGDSGEPVWIPGYPSESGDTLITRLQNRVRRHKRILLAETTWENARKELRKSMLDPEPSSEAVSAESPENQDNQDTIEPHTPNDAITTTPENDASDESTNPADSNEIAMAADPLENSPPEESSTEESATPDESDSPETANLEDQALTEEAAGNPINLEKQDKTAEPTS